MQSAQAEIDPARSSLRTTLLGVLVNTILAMVKYLAGVLGNSYALIADAMESTLDIFSSLMVWGGLRIASTPPDEGHPYGHGKAESLTTMVISLALLGAAVGLAIQSLREILDPHQKPPAPFTLGVLVGVVITKELLFRFVSGVGKAVGSSAVKADAWHHRSDAITSLAAFIGISIAILGGKGYESADDWAALAACGIIAFNGIRLLRPALGEVMDVAASADVHEAIRRAASEVGGVVEVEKCRVRKYGFTYVVDIHVMVDGDMSVRRGHEIAHEVKRALCTSTLKVSDALVHIEPAKVQGS